MRRLALAIVGVPSVAIAVAIVAAIAGAGAQACTSSEGGPVGGVPAQLVPLFQGAAAQYNLGPAGAAILAAINYEESDFDQSTLPGVHAGANGAGAAGPMQIGIGGKAGDTWDLVKVNAPDDPAGAPPNVYDEADAVYSAGHYLELNGLTADPSTWRNALWLYNHADWYVSAVLERARAYYSQGLRTGGSSAVFVSSSSRSSCPVNTTGGYVNPFAHAQVNASRIDQGVDYGGRGPIDALGPGRVVLVSSSDTAWGNGDGWVSYQLTGGSYAGEYVYVAEGITPSVHGGQALAAGQPIGTFNGHSIEIGFAAGQADIALANPVYHPDGADTAAGRAMNQLLTSLGAPPGHRDMADCGGTCPIVGGPVPQAPAVSG
jgi:hypothetical protein